MLLERVRGLNLVQSPGFRSQEGRELAGYALNWLGGRRSCRHLTCLERSKFQGWRLANAGGRSRIYGLGIITVLCTGASSHPLSTCRVRMKMRVPDGGTP